MRGLSYYERLGQTDSPPDVGGGLLNTILTSANNEITIRSQVTPEIKVDVNELLKSGGQEPKQAVKGQGNFFLNLIKPEIQIEIMGVKRTVAPYGTPTEDLSTVLIAGSAGLLVLGGAIAFFICKKVL